MKRKALIALSLAACCATRAVPSAEPRAQNPEIMLARIKKEGAAAVIKSLWGIPAKWNELTDKVATGNAAWVDVAVALGPGSDAGSTSELEDALFVALGQNAEYVLRVLPPEEYHGNPLALSDICGGRTDPLGTYAESIAEQKRIEAAVKNVSDKALASRRRRCLTELSSGETDLKRFFEVP